MRISSRWMLPMLAAIATLVVGCAQQVGDIDRTNPNALLKADFTDGEWYIRQTVSEVPPAAFAGFVGLTSSMDKIRWEITEDYLIAYRSYENNPGSREEIEVDAEGNIVYVDGADEGFNDEFKESAIAAYPISSHFDIQRGYSSSTGEQTNVISENTSDRDWYERDYFRVSWSNALDNATIWGADMFNGYEWYLGEEDPDANSRFRIEYFNPNDIEFPGIQADDYQAGAPYYLDFTNRMLVDNAAYCMGWYPSLLFDCGTAEVEVMTSILRVPDVQRYEPTTYDDIDQQKFGYFRTERLVWDERLGTRLSGQILLSNRHNIWKDSWQRDANGDRVRDSQGRPMALPMNQRELDPVVYHLSPNHPEELEPAVQHIEGEWNRAFTRTAAAAQGVDPSAVSQRMFIVCHNPVAEADPVECGEVGLEARIGDLRFNVIYWVNNNQMTGPLGYGPSAPDPETGEIISGTAYVYGAAIDTYSNYALELIQFLNGDLTVDGLMDADYIRDQMETRLDPNLDPRAMVDFDASLADFDLADIELREIIPEGAVDFLEYVDVNGLNDFAHRPDQQRQRWEYIEETGWGSLAFDDEMARGLMAEFHVASLDDIPEDVMNDIFSEGTLRLPQMVQAHQDRLAELAENNIMMAESLDDTIVGMAMNYRGRTDYEAIWTELRNLIYQGVMEHEVGHTVGLRHNFQGSYDSLNYFDEYWDLKTSGMLGVTEGGAVDVVPFARPGNLAEIYGMAQQTPQQIEGQMREFQYSTIMDYHSQFNMDNRGIGKYDEAAIIYAYTAGRDATVRDFDTSHPLFNTQERGYVEVFNNVGDARSIFEQFEGLDSPGYTDMLEQFHYSTVATEMGSDGGSYQGRDAIMTRMSDRRLRRFSALLNEREAGVAGRDIEVPYLFLSDLWRGARQSARTWDQGADPLEQALNMIERYRTYYAFTYFRRDRSDWSPFDIVNSLMGRYYGDLMDNYQRWLFNVAIRESADDVLANGWTFGAFASLNLFTEILTTPSYGSYTEDDNGVYQLSSYSRRDNAELYLAPGEGRRPFSQYDADLGYNYFMWPNEAGHFWAQYGAFITLAASTSIEVRGADVGADFLSYSIPPYLVFPDEMTNLFNAFFLENTSMIGPRVIRDGDGKFEMQHRLFAGLELNDGSQMNPETGASVDIAAMITGDINADVGATIDPYYSFTQQYLPILYGFAFFTSNLSLDYPDQGQIYRVGSGETVVGGEGFEVIEVCNPANATGECYAALMETGAENPPLAAALILQTQGMIEDGEQEFTIANQFELMNLLRSLYRDFGRNF